MLRTRGLSAIVIVAPLLIALALGTWALAILLAVVAAIAAGEAFRLLQGGGLPVARAVRDGRSRSRSCSRRSGGRVGDKGLLLVAIGTVLAGIGAFSFQDPRDGLLAWIATVFGAVYVGLIAFVLHVAGDGARGPGRRPARVARARSAAGCCS